MAHLCDLIENEIDMMHDAVSLVLPLDEFTAAFDIGSDLPRQTQKRSKLTAPRWSVPRTQLNQLEEIFRTVKAPSATLRQFLSEKMGVTPRQIQVWFRNRRQRVRLAKLRGDVDPSELDAPVSLSLPESAEDDNQTDKSAEASVMAAMMGTPAAHKFESVPLSRAPSPTHSTHSDANSDAPTEIAALPMPILTHKGLNHKRMASPDSITEQEPAAKALRPGQALLEFSESGEMNARSAHDTFGICLMKAFENIHHPQSQLAPKANLFTPSDPIFSGVGNREQSPTTAPAEPLVAAGAGYYMPPTMSDPAPASQMELLRMQQVVRMQQGLLEMQSRVFSSMMSNVPMSNSVSVNPTSMMNARVPSPMMPLPVEQLPQTYGSMPHPMERNFPAYTNNTCNKASLYGNLQPTAYQNAYSLPMPTSSHPGTAPTSPYTSSFPVPVDSDDSLLLDDLLAGWE